MSGQHSAPDPTRVYFLEEACGFLRMSRRTADRLRRAGTFPLAELPSLDRRARFSGAEILRFIEGQETVAVRRHARIFAAGGRRA